MTNAVRSRVRCPVRRDARVLFEYTWLVHSGVLQMFYPRDVLAEPNLQRAIVRRVPTVVGTASMPTMWQTRRFMLDQL